MWYIPGGNVLDNNDGNMGVFYDRVFEIKDGEWLQIGDGECRMEDNTNPEYDENGDYVFRYKWDGKEVTKKKYEKKLKKLFGNRKPEALGNEAVSYHEIINQISQYSIQKGCKRDMRCKNCGTENPDGSRFCATCGKPLEQEEPAKNVAEQKEEAVQNAEEQKEEAVQNTEETLTSTAETKSLTHKKSRGLNKFLIGLACAVVVVVIAAGLLISRARRTIDLNKYVTFETTGYNGYGNVYPQIDWEKIQKKYDSRLKFTKEFEEQYGKNTDSISPVAVL